MDMKEWSTYQVVCPKQRRLIYLTSDYHNYVQYKTMVVQTVNPYLSYTRQ
jgi:hypothetical protein